MSKIYQGHVENGETIVTVDGKPLAHIKQHSTTGFSWGYAGSGPADLALSILTDLLCDDTQTNKQRLLAEYRAVKLHQEFKFDFIAGLPWLRPWQITSEEINNWINSQE